MTFYIFKLLNILFFFFYLRGFTGTATKVCFITPKIRAYTPKSQPGLGLSNSKNRTKKKNKNILMRASIVLVVQKQLKSGNL
jgi:hypothetical protein